MRQLSKGTFELTPEQRTRLERRLQESGVSSPAGGDRIVPRRNGTHYAALSFAQQRLWFLDQIEPGNAFYNIPSFIRLAYALDVNALHRSLDEIVRRHEVLRTTFAVVDGEPVQVVGSARSIPMPIVDLSGLSASGREAEAKRLATEEARRPFDLCRDLPVRAMLVRLGTGDHLLLLTIHHIVSDGWSTGVFYSELAALYRAFCEGKPSPLPELKIQYADFAAWQRQWMSGELLEAQLGYWKKRLAGLPRLRLPTDHPRPAVATYRGAFHFFAMSRSVSEALLQLARREGVTPFMLLAAGFKALLHRYTGQDDIVVGAPIANRHHAQTEPLIGFFVNTLVLRTDLSGNPTFLELMGRVKEMALGAYANQDLPFERLVEELEPERSLSSNPLFQVGFVLQTAWNLFAAPGRGGDNPSRDSVASALDVERGTAIFDLAVHLWETPLGLKGGFEYSTDLFESATIARMATHFTNLLESAVANPHARVSELALLTSAERRQLLEDFSGVRAGPAAKRCIHHVLEEQARRAPNSIAVAFGDRTMTWRVLNEEANQLAHYLQRMGVGPEIRVGICMERSLRMIVSVLAVLKAGGAYVPLDPSYPVQRRAFMVRNASVAVLIAQHDVAEQMDWPARDGLKQFCVDTQWDAVSSCSRSDPVSGATPENLAYIIYTSGSTGAPKGVLLRHQGLCNMVDAQLALFGLSRDDRVLQFASLTFDASIFEIVMALGSGATLCLAGQTDLMPGPGLAALLREQAISIVTLPPSALAALGHDEYPALRTICVAGEACPASLASRWSKGRRFFNLYGPTEATVWTTYAEHREEIRDPPIGTPIPHVYVYVLDEHLEPVPIGVSGELCIGGVGLARGYAESPEQTAEKFIRDPFTAHEDARLYRTGDLARYLPDGQLEYRGRKDNQIKLRGHRIELGEIESVLNSHPSVQEAVVVARDDPPGERRLVAYVIQQPEGESAGNTCRDAEGAAEQVSYWRTMYDETYRQSGGAADPALDFHGWTSSYTGEPIPQREMRAWIDHTIDRVLAHPTERVLEIGCGNGLVLLRAAPHSTEYWGTDFSAAALRALEERIQARGAGGAAISLYHRDANDFDGLPRGRFDAVVLNSVAQYFPGIDYLLEVVRGAAELLTPHGFMYLGDLRSLPLLQAFHASVELHGAQDDLSIATLRERVRKHTSREQELVVDPRFFDELTRIVPRFGRARIELKRGSDDNELTKFRYDVTLLAADGGDADGDARGLAWGAEQWTFERLHAFLRTEQPASLCVSGIPNARISYETTLMRLLSEPGLHDVTTAGELRAAARAAAPAGLDPEAFWAFGSRLGYDVEVTWSPSGAEDFDVRFRRETHKRASFPAGPAFSRRTRSRHAVSLRKYANDPVHGRVERARLPDIRRFLEQQLPEYMVPSTFVPVSELPRNVSGKVDRGALPVPDTARPDLKDDYVAPMTPKERVLTAIWASILGVERIGIHDNFFELGGDSILSIQIISRASRAGITLTPKDIFQNQTIAQLCSVTRTATRADAEQGIVSGVTPLTPIQRWFFELDLAEPAHFNQAVAMDVTGLDPSTLGRTLECLLAHHDALRSRFLPGKGGWMQLNESPGLDVPFHREDFSALPGSKRDAAMQAATLRWQKSLSLESGPLVRLVLLHQGGGAPDRLLWIIHHLVVDGVSWRVLFEDMDTAYNQLRQGREPQLPRKTTSFRTWAERLADYASSSQLAAELPFWLDLANAQPAPLPHDHALGPNDVGSTYNVATTLGSDETRALLNEIPEALRARINEVLVTALAQTLGDWTGSQTILIDMEGHGREGVFDDVDVSRTVGWFTSLFPLVLTLEDVKAPGDALLSVKEQLRRVPNRGIGYGVLRYVGRDASTIMRLRSLPQADIAFNYLGQFGLAGMSSGEPHALDTARDATRSDLALRRHAIEVNASVVGGVLRTQWTFSANLHARSSAERLVAEYGNALTRLIDHCRSRAPARFGPSDFEHARVSQSDLDRLVAAIGAGRPV
jgi:amino acid adenylation domain-containing protein/non-ribosomal peptide synthase protein (TIGR01720 family)